MYVNLQLDISQLLSMIKQLSDEEKLKVADFLKKELLKQELPQMREKYKDVPATFEEITEIVEKVRQERYESSH